MTATPNGEPKAPEDNATFAEATSGSQVEDQRLNPDAHVETDPRTKDTGNGAVEAELPKSNASKEAWVKYAKARQINVEGLTTAQIKARLSAASPEAEESTGSDEEVLSTVDNANLPISAVVGEILGTVRVNPAGIVVLDLTMNGYIGIDPLSVPVEDAGDFEAVLESLRAQVKSL